ncbi:MAG: hypothetical protein JSU90_01115 [Nitrospiraceae bacterium]|nr:MAG: hypothetical protein JSU90_01115 [Nitrospiraceae bacterium]
MINTLNVIILLLGLTSGFLSAGAHAESAGQGVRNTTPYGDYCTRTSHYGTHHGVMSDRQVRNSLNHYYHGRGLSVTITSLEGRFIKAHVKKGNVTLDTIILDRLTGRIRSIY